MDLVLGEELLFKSLLDKSFKFLSYRPRSKAEVWGFLNSKIAEEKDYWEIRDKVLEKLEALNLINDLEFAEWLKEQRLSSRNPKGFLAIKQELLLKGVARELISQINPGSLDPDKEANIFSFLVRKEKVLKYSLGHQRKQKLLQILRGRGFDFGESQRLLDKFLANH